MGQDITWVGLDTSKRDSIVAIHKSDPSRAAIDRVLRTATPGFIRHLRRD